MGAWKQPIPTDLYLTFGDDHAANLLYRELIYRASNDERIMSIGGSRIKIKRGEVLFSRSSFTKFLQWNTKKCARVLKDLEDFYKKVSRRSVGKYTLVELLNYDAIVYMGQEATQEATEESTRRMATPKSEESVENDENEKINRDITIKKEIKEKMFSDKLETAISDFVLYRKQKGKRYAMGPTAEKLFRNRIAAALPALREQRIIKEIENSIEKGYQSILYDWKPPVLAGQNKKDEYVEEIPEEKEEAILVPTTELEEFSEEIPEETNFMSEEEWEEMATTHASELYEKFYNPITLQK